MSAEEIRKYDPNDEELKSVLGEHFQDNSTGKYQNESKGHKDCSDKVGKFSQPRRGAMDAEYTKVTEYTSECKNEAEVFAHRPVNTANLVECARSVGFGGLTALLFYWEHIGLMAETVAVPSMILSATLFGLGIGKVVGKR